MITIKHTFRLSEFTYFNLDTATGITDFENMLIAIKERLYSQIPSALAKEYGNHINNTDYGYNNYVIELKKEYWGELRINEEIANYRVGSLYRNNIFNTKDSCYCDRTYMYKKIEKLKPFDLCLYIKTIDEYKKEELIKECKEKGLVPIFIKDNYKEKE